MRLGATHTTNEVIRAALLLALPAAAFVLVSKSPLVALPLAALAGLSVLRRLDWIAYAVVFVAFTRADVWATGLTGLPAGTITVLIIVIAVVVALVYEKLPLAAPNAAFAVLVLFFSTAFLTGALFGQPDHAYSWCRDALYAFVTFTAVFCFSAFKDRYWKLLFVVVGCGILLSVINILEIAFPSAVQLSHSEGRAAGLLKNANTSAFVITSSFVALQLCQRRIPRFGAWAVPIQVLLFAGVLATFSRAGMLMMTAAVLISIVIELKRRRFLRVLLYSVLAGSVLVTAAAKYFLGSSDLSVLYSVQKIATFVQGRIDDNYRFFLAKYYFLKFLEHPLTGYGFYATVFPSAANTDLVSVFGVKGPHNTPIAILAEFGVIPALFYALAYAVVLLRLTGVENAFDRKYLYLLWFLVLIHNAFAHDSHLSRPTMVLLGILAAAPVLAKKSPQPGERTAELKNGEAARRGARPKPFVQDGST